VDHPAPPLFINTHVTDFITRFAADLFVADAPVDKLKMKVIKIMNIQGTLWVYTLQVLEH
jgi:hypothetical protein